MRTARLLALTTALLCGCAEQEGDFTINMPEGSARSDRETVTLEIRLTADGDGKLSGVFLDGEQLVAREGDGGAIELLHRRVREIVQHTDAEPMPSPEYEAVIQADYELDYPYIADALKAISSYTDSNGAVHDLLTSVKFAPPAAKPPPPKNAFLNFK